MATDVADQLKQKVLQAQDLAGDALVSALKEAEEEINALQNKLSAYHQRQFEELLKPLREKVKKSKIKTFSFKKSDDSDNKSAVGGPQNIVRKDPVRDPLQISADQSLTEKPTLNPQVHEESLAGKDLEFSDLVDEVIFITVPLSALTLHRLVRCKVYVASIIHSSFVVRDTTMCEIHCRAKQVRIHDARNCDFFLDCVTPPIIERSMAVCFGPYTLQSNLRIVARDDAQSMFNAETYQNYTRVKDFNWLKPKQSPNWSTRDKRVATAEEAELLGRDGITFG